MELFPQSSHRLADRLLDALQAQLTPQQIQAIFSRMVDDIAGEHGNQFEDRSLEDKIETLVTILGEEGFLSRVERVGQDFQVTQHGCPYQYVVERHPGICAIDLQLMNTTLGTNVERESWILKGDTVCTFHVRAASENINPT
jgi:predicted ArsR family transcriptional regulator